MEQAPILFTLDHDIATLILNRPSKRNAFDDKIIYQLIEYLQRAEADNTVRMIVIRGNGNHFCAGADIAWMQKAAQYSFEENQRDALKLAQLMQFLYQIKKPTITLVQGSVYGGGIGLVACSDIVLAAPSTQFCFSEVKLGLVPAVVGPYVIQAIGLRVAKRYMLTAEIFDANKAKDMGLIHEVIPDEDIDNYLVGIIQKLQNNGPMALRRTKEMLQHFEDIPKGPTHFLEYTTELIAKLRASQEAQLGFEAFLNKQTPVWQ